MELKDYISQTIEQISLGIIDAQKKNTELGIIVNPNITIGEGETFAIPKKPEHIIIQRRVTLLKMDISVTVNETEEDKIDGKIGVSFLSIGGNTTDTKSNINQNRIQFSIPVALPVSDVIV